MPQIRGAFPWPITGLSQGGARIQLPTGGTFYPPSGNYYVLLDANTIAQIWDPIEQVWRTYTAASNGQDLYCDGFNVRLLNTTGIVNSLSISNAGSGMTNGIGPTATGVSLSVAAPATTGAPTATGYVVVGGSVAAPTIVQAGSGFLVAPLIVIDPPPVGGTQATAVAALTSGGAIASITMVNVGAGYVASPNFWVIPQTNAYQGSPSGGVAAGANPPAGAVYPGNALSGNQNTSATGVQLSSVALTGSGTITAAKLINQGGGYTAASPAVTLTGAAGGAALTSTVSNTTPANSLALNQSLVQ